MADFLESIGKENFLVLIICVVLLLWSLLIFLKLIKRIFKIIKATNRRDKQQVKMMWLKIFCNFVKSSVIINLIHGVIFCIFYYKVLRD